MNEVDKVAGVTVIDAQEAEAFEARRDAGYAAPANFEACWTLLPLRSDLRVDREQFVKIDLCAEAEGPEVQVRPAFRPGTPGA